MKHVNAYLFYRELSFLLPSELEDNSMSSSETESIPEPQYEYVTTDGQNENDTPNTNDSVIVVNSVNSNRPSDIKSQGMQTDLKLNCSFDIYNFLFINFVNLFLEEINLPSVESESTKLSQSGNYYLII